MSRPPVQQATPTHHTYLVPFHATRPHRTPSLTGVHTGHNAARPPPPAPPQVHSKKSLAAVIERTKARGLDTVPEEGSGGPGALPKVEPPVVAVLDTVAEGLAAKKKLVSQLPYMVRARRGPWAGARARCICFPLLDCVPFLCTVCDGWARDMQCSECA
jgi:hypothetical protein